MSREIRDGGLCLYVSLETGGQSTSRASSADQETETKGNWRGRDELGEPSLTLGGILLPNFLFLCVFKSKLFSCVITYNVRVYRTSFITFSENLNCLGFTGGYVCFSRLVKVLKF